MYDSVDARSICISLRDNVVFPLHRSSSDDANDLGRTSTVIGQVNKFVPGRPLLLCPPIISTECYGEETGGYNAPTPPIPPLPLHLAGWWLLLLPHHYFMRSSVSASASVPVADTNTGGIKSATISSWSS